MHKQFDRKAYADFIGADRPRMAHYSAVIDRLPVFDQRAVRILDIGCGSGDFEALLAQKFPDRFNVVGYDPSGSLIDEASAKQIPNTQFHEFSSSNFSAQDSFDAAVSILVLPYPDSLKELQNIFAAASKHLEAGQRFISVTFNPDFCVPDEQILANRRFNRLGIDGIEINFLSRDGNVLFQSKGKKWERCYLSRAARNAGFSGIKWSPLYLNYGGERVVNNVMPNHKQPYGILECTK